MLPQPLGKVGFFATVASPEKGIVCSDFAAVDTGSPIYPIENTVLSSSLPIQD